MLNGFGFLSSSDWDVNVVVHPKVLSDIRSGASVGVDNFRAVFATKHVRVQFRRVIPNRQFRFSCKESSIMDTSCF